MQLIQLERDGWNFFCPATGEPVFKGTSKNQEFHIYKSLQKNALRRQKV